ncbi:thioredoxin domain-containing protein [Candidatus Fokinia crypta]|uniref:Thioredoxin domain-containing protein n=1 Tax=Candidatus Fokinia crypta TaxID=1920990 RepID=A0ABZ0UR49_9RICK|nr:hypothetical protein [Candidatus Fokinia cryptica]WPX98179.1 hypothetical protein Fokcrypt_00720 [Candidatus Fokinia cryptica]
MIQFLFFTIFFTEIVILPHSFASTIEDSSFRHSYCNSNDHITANYNLLNIPFTTVDTEPLSLAHLYQKKVVIAFWTQWDIEAFGLLKAMHVMEKYTSIKGNSELFLIAIAIDTPSTDVIDEIFKKNGITLQHSFIDTSLVFSNAIPSIMTRTNVMLFTEGKYCILTEQERTAFSHQEPEDNELMIAKYFLALIEKPNTSNKDDFVFHVKNESVTQPTQHNDKDTNIVIYSSHSKDIPKLIQ